MTDFLNLVSGIVIGILTNLAAWWILFHYLVPKVGFAPLLSKKRIKQEDDDQSGYRYRFKIENSGRRDIIDIELTARLSILGLGSGRNWEHLYIPLESGDKSYRIPRLLPVRKGRSGGRRTIRLAPNMSPELLGREIYPDEIRDKVAHKKLLLEELFKLGKEAKFEIQAYCYDNFSGTRKLYVSYEYGADDFFPGDYAPNSLLPEDRSFWDRIDWDRIDRASRPWWKRLFGVDRSLGKGQAYSGGAQSRSERL